MSKEFIWILGFILLTLAFWVGIDIMREQRKEISIDISKEEIYKPLDPSLDLEFLSELESNR